MMNYKRHLGFLLLYIISLFLITLCWVGAEYVLEGVVHSSKVDGGVTFILSFYVTKGIMPYVNYKEKEK